MHLIQIFLGLIQIVVGCEADTCEDHHSVLLQYRKDAR